MKLIVTGTAGFIGCAVALRLLERGDTVIGIDNHNAYYDPQLKAARVARLTQFSNYRHHKFDLANRDALHQLFEAEKPARVVNLAAQAGVRYSLDHPATYIDANIVGFMNILEACRQYPVEHLVFASSSSVYGANMRMPFSEQDGVDHPLSLYAATKKSNELMAHAYSHLFHVPCTGLRFFTVYGPWGRPDMAYFKFTRDILAGEPITVFNHGHHQRDFTYIDDIVEGVIRVINKPATPQPEWDAHNPSPHSSNAPWQIYNIGHGNPIALMAMIEALEQALGVSARLVFSSKQPGDVDDTHADVRQLHNDFGYRPSTSLNQGLRNFVAWYRDYFKV
jgi:UDP-glucuronate 4-epimerase